MNRASELSKRICSLRFLLMVFVVFIHNTTINTGVSFSDGSLIFEIPPYVAKIKELVGAFTSAAVPLFFLISGFLLYSKDQKFLENLRKKCRTILLPYFLWSILMVIFFFLFQSLGFTKAYFARLIVRDFSLADWVGVFLGYFGQFSTDSSPLVYQFWFLRDLFVLNLLFVVIKRFIDLSPAAALGLFFILWIGSVNIYIVNPVSLFFFSLGYCVVKYNISYKCVDNIKTSDIVILYVIVILGKLFFREEIPVILRITGMVGALFFIKLSYWFVSKEKVYNVLEKLEKYSFWLYATHGIVIAVMIKISVKLMPMHGVWLLVHYFGVTILCVLVLLAAGVVFRKMFPRTFSVLSGGR